MNAGSAATAREGPFTAGEWARNWPLVVSATLGMSIGSIAIFALGQFIAPIEAELGWSRTKISAVVSLPALMMCLSAGLLGQAIGRFDLRHLAILGIVLCTGAIASFSLVGGDYTGWVAAWAVYSIGAAVTAPTLWVTAAARAFERDRSFAMTVVLCGVGLASTFGPALSRFLIDSSDWREAFRWLALIWGGGCLALCLLWFRSKPIATPAARGAAAAATGPVAARTLIASAAVVQLTAAVFLVMTVLAGLMVSLSPLLVDGGMPQSTAAKVAGALGLGVITGKLGSGRIFEKLRVPVLAGMVMAALALACVVLGLTGLPTALVALGCFALGLSSGGLMAISACLPARLFDQREFGVVYGWLIGVMGAASIAGPLCASLVHDWLGSYRLVLWSGIAVAALGAILLSSASRSSMQVVPSDG